MECEPRGHSTPTEQTVRRMRCFAIFTIPSALCGLRAFARRNLKITANIARASAEDANQGHGMWAGTSLCYTNGHHHETHIAVRALFACTSNRGRTNNFRADCESNRSSYAAGKASAQRASAYLWRAECRSLLFRRWQEADLSVVAWRCEMRPDFHDEHRRQRSAHDLDRQGTHH